MVVFLLILISFLAAAPQYFVIVFHTNFYAYQFHTSNFDLIWIVVAIIFGLLISSVLSKFVLGSFLLLFFGLIIFTLCCLALSIGSIANAAKYHWYIGVMLIAGVAIGLVQPNNAAMYGDQFTNTNIQHFFVYVLIHTIAMGLAIAASLSPKLRNPKSKCPSMNCYSFVYLMCMVSSGAAFLLLIVVCLMRSVFVVRPILVNKRFDSNDLKRLNIFSLLMIPLSVNFVIYFLLETEWPKQAKNLNPIIGHFFVQEIHLQALCTIIAIGSVPVAMALSIRKENGLMKISFASVLVCLASLYMGQIFSYSEESFYDAPVVHKDDIRVKMFNGQRDVQFSFEQFNFTKIVPFHGRLGPYYFYSNNSPVSINGYFLAEQRDSKFSLNFSGINTGITICYWYTETKMAPPYKEVTHRDTTGLVLLRILFNTVFDKVHILCIKSKALDKCSTPKDLLLQQIPSGIYVFSYNSEFIGQYALANGGYYTFCLSSINSAEDQTVESIFLTPYTIIPPYKLSVAWQVVVYILLSLAKVFCFSAGLDVAYLIAKDQQKSLFISCLYSFYLGAWVVYRLIDIFYGFNIRDNFNLVTFVSALAAAAFFCGCYTWSYLLNRKE